MVDSAFRRGSFPFFMKSEADETFADLTENIFFFGRRPPFAER